MKTSRGLKTVGGSGKVFEQATFETGNFFKNMTGK